MSEYRKYLVVPAEGYKGNFHFIEGTADDACQTYLMLVEMGHLVEVYRCEIVEDIEYEAYGKPTIVDK